MISILCFTEIIDGRDFSKFYYYECTNKYGTQTSMAYALRACREDAQCSMIGSSSCNDTSSYYLCEKGTHISELKNELACTYRKKGNSYNMYLRFIIIL